MTIGGRNEKQRKMKNKKDSKEMYSKAMEYLSQGKSIFPVGLDKKPHVKTWKEFQKRHPTDLEVEAWWQEWPNAGIAIITGKISGLSVVDVDTYKGGDPSPFPETKTIESTTGGLHFWYEYSPEAWTHDNKATHVDVRSEGGYVIAPPSRAERKDGKGIGTYKVTKDIPLAPFPTHLFPKKGQKRDWKAIEAGKPEGSRNSDMAAFFGRMLGKLPSDEWEPFVWPAGQFLDSRNSPPLGDVELRRIFDSIAGREISSTSGNELKLSPLTLGDLYKRKFPPSRWLVKDLIPLGGLTAETGEPASFKTFLTQALAVNVATGTPFLGHFETIKGKVLIVDQENQLRLVKERFELLDAKASENVFFLSQEGVKIDKKSHIDHLVEVVEEINPVLVVMDSLVRFHRGDENTARDMSLFFEAASRLSSDERSVVFIHHHRKQLGFGRQSTAQNIRGSSDIPAAVECHLAVDRKAEDLLTITQTKLRVQKELKRFKVALTTDANGKVSFVYKGEDDSENEEMVEAQDKIKKALEKTSMLGVEELANKTKVAESRIRKALKELVNGKDVVELKAAHNKSIFTLALTETTKEAEGDVIEEKEITKSKE